MNFRLWQRRTILSPTLLGWGVLLMLAVGLVVGWGLRGEAFLSADQRVPADVLVVEGWIGIEGLNAAKEEFDHGGYRYLVTAGGWSRNSWDGSRWNYAEGAQAALLKMGLPEDQVIAAPAPDSAEHRTFSSAVTVWRKLRDESVRPKGVMVFTMDVHARRSRLVFAKVFGPEVGVGVVSWTPKYLRAGPWWRSSIRSEEFLKETVGYLFEILLNSGRRSNSPEMPAQPVAGG